MFFFVSESPLSVAFTLAAPFAPLFCLSAFGTHTHNHADKTPDEVRREFNIKEPFSPEVERTLREENKWSTEPPIGS